MSGDARLLCAAGDAEDHVRVQLRLADGCLVDLLASSAVAVDLPRLICCGNAGTLVWEGEDLVIRSVDPATVPRAELDLGPRTAYAGQPVPWQEERLPITSLPGSGDFYDHVADVLRQDHRP